MKRISIAVLTIAAFITLFSGCADAWVKSIMREINRMYTQYDEVEDITFINDSFDDIHFDGGENSLRLYLGMRGKIDEKINENYLWHNEIEIWPVMALEAYCGKEGTPNSVSNITVNVDGQIFHIDDLPANDVAVDRTETGKRIRIHTGHKINEYMEMFEAIANAQSKVTVRLRDRQNDRYEFDLSGQQVNSVRHVLRLYSLINDAYLVGDEYDPDNEYYPNMALSAIADTFDRTAQAFFDSIPQWMRVISPGPKDSDDVGTYYAMDHVARTLEEDETDVIPLVIELRTKDINAFIPELRNGMSRNDVADYFKEPPYSEDASKQVFRFMSQDERACEIVVLYDNDGLAEVKIRDLSNVPNGQRAAKFFEYRDDAPKVFITVDRYAVPKIKDMLTILNFGYARGDLLSGRMKEGHRVEFTLEHGGKAALRTFYMPDQTLQVVEFYKTGTKNVERTAFHAYRMRGDVATFNEIRPGISKDDAIKYMGGAYDHYNAKKHTLEYNSNTVGSGQIRVFNEYSSDTGSSGEIRVDFKLNSDDIVEEITIYNSQNDTLPVDEDSRLMLVFEDFSEKRSAPTGSPVSTSSPSSSPDFDKFLLLLPIVGGVCIIVVGAVAVFLVKRKKSVPAGDNTTEAARQSPAERSTSFCSKCGAGLATGVNFCGMCGARIGSPVEAANDEPPSQGKIVANDAHEQRYTRFRCPKCHHELDPHATVCPGCGIHLKPRSAQHSQHKSVRYLCPKCHHELEPGAKVCPGCGVRFKNRSAS